MRVKEVEEIAMTDAAVRSALEAEEKFLSVEAERYLYEMREKAYYDNRSALYSARLDERMKIARSLLQNGASVELVKKSLGLSDADLEKLLL